ncbi:helicase HerA-like domain-containing protein [Sorangium sp. So ce341]|uniref:helicase HerA-like domain-containing protein n=1 Tax=Sorangium sp. So ce341 TaxID=3133302 RepID=UPI003F63D5B3
MGADPGGVAARPLELPAHHLVTHGVVVGMTGSGKTGLVLVLVEEARSSGVPVLMVDVKAAWVVRAGARRAALRAPSPRGASGACGRGRWPRTTARGLLRACPRHGQRRPSS